VRDFENFLGEPPPSGYTFLFSVADDSIVRGGALEHRKSSLYRISTAEFDKLKQLPWVIRHELYHTFIPLELRGEDIAALDFVGMHPVEHLWFYEGLTQWATYKMQLINRTISPRQYLGEIRRSLIIADRSDDSIALIPLSRNILEDGSSYTSIYRRGLVLGALLDLHIIARSRGEVTLRETLLEMKSQYPRGKEFRTDSLFSIIASLTHPSVEEFLTDYLVHKRMPDMERLFRWVGINYTARRKHPYIHSELGLVLKASESTDHLVVLDVHSGAERYGYQQGDTLLAVDNQPVTADNFGISTKHLMTSMPGVKYKADVKGIDGGQRSITAFSKPLYLHHVFEIMPEPNRLRRVWATR
jgi:predicted metalloprotease with PDZ domain